MENFIINGNENHTYFKDITLEFKGLPRNFNEKDFQDKCNEIIDYSVVEVSFLYDLKEYFELKNKLEKLLEDKNQNSEVKETA